MMLVGLPGRGGDLRKQRSAAGHEPGAPRAPCGEEGEAGAGAGAVGPGPARVGDLGARP